MALTGATPSRSTRLSEQTADNVSITGGAVAGVTLSNPTISGATISGASANITGNETIGGMLQVAGLTTIGDTTAPAGQTQLGLMVGTDTGGGNPLILRKSNNGANGVNIRALKSRGTQASPSAVQAADTSAALIGTGFDGTNYTDMGQLQIDVDGSVSAGVVPGRVRIFTANAAGVITLAVVIDKQQLPYWTASGALTAAGSSRSGALAVTKKYNQITTAAASTGVVLPVALAGLAINVFNDGANAITVYAAGSDSIDGTAGSTGVPLTNAKRCAYICFTDGAWISAQWGTVSA